MKKKDDEGNSFLEPWGDVDIFEIDKSTTGRAYWKDVFGKLCSPCLEFVEKSLDVTPELRSCIAAGVTWLEQEVVVLERVVVEQKEKYTAQREKYSKRGRTPRNYTVSKRTSPCGNQTLRRWTWASEI